MAEVLDLIDRMKDQLHQLQLAIDRHKRQVELSTDDMISHRRSSRLLDGVESILEETSGLNESLDSLAQACNERLEEQTGLRQALQNADDDLANASEILGLEGGTSTDLINRLFALKTELQKLKEEREPTPPASPPQESPWVDPTCREDFARDNFQSGTSSFNQRNYRKARSDFLRVIEHLKHVPNDRRETLDTFAFQYQLAVGRAYVEDICAAEKALTEFLACQGAPSHRALDRRAEQLDIAHAQHLLAQALVGMKQSRQAAEVCQSALQLRRRHLGHDHQCTQQTLALLHCVAGYTGDQVLAQSALDGIVERFSTIVSEAYKTVRPLSKEEQTISSGDSPMRPNPSGTDVVWELLPIWEKQRLDDSRSETLVEIRPPPSRAPADTLVDRMPNHPLETRKQWLRDLNLKAVDADNGLSDRLIRAIQDGNGTKVASLLNDHYRPMSPSLHLSVVIGNTRISKRLLQYKAKPELRCRAAGHATGGTPMHLAVGTQNLKMMSLLSTHKATFSWENSHEHGCNVAPPAWLIDHDWLRRTNCTRADVIVHVLEHMKSLGWDPEAVLDDQGRNMRQLAKDTLRDRPEIRDAVVTFVNNARKPTSAA